MSPCTSSSSLPLYNVPGARTTPMRRVSRLFVLALIAILLVIMLLNSTGKGLPLIRKNLEKHIIVQTHVEAATEIYRGFERPRYNLDHLIVVAGQAILLDPWKYMEDEAWVLEPYQKGEVETFVNHIIKGVDLAFEDSHSLLVFSGYITSSLFFSSLEAKHAGWLDLVAKLNRTGLLQVISIAIPRRSRNSFWGE
jgi:hypothetical protein